MKSDYCKVCGYPLAGGACDNGHSQDGEYCLGCTIRLDLEALEIGSGYCATCGHKEFANELARLERDAAAIAALAGFPTLAAARAHVARTR